MNVPVSHWGGRAAGQRVDSGGSQPPWWQGWWRDLERALARQRQRRALARLDERLLRDVGITPEEAQAEAAKPFWRY